MCHLEFQTLPMMFGLRVRQEQHRELEQDRLNMHRAAFAGAQRVSGCTASVGMHSWALAYANSGLDVLHTTQKSPQTPEARFHSPPASPIPLSSRGQAEYSPGTAQGHHQHRGILQHPHCRPWRCHIATWAPATHKPRRGEQRKPLIVSGGPSLVSALHEDLAAGPVLGLWRAARRGVAGTCPCWETWRPRRAPTVSSVLTSRLLEFTSGFPPSRCQGARPVPTAPPRRRRGAFPSCPPRALGSEQMGPIKVFLSSSTSGKCPSQERKNKARRGFSLICP